MYPETAGKTLEQLGEVFGDGDVAVRINKAKEAGGAGSASASAEDGGMLDCTAFVAEPLQLPSASTLELEGTSEITLSDPDEVTAEGHPPKKEES